MHFLTKHRLCFWMMAAWTAVMLFCAPVLAADTVSVRMAHHEKFTRIVFDLPRLMAYHVNTEAGKVTVDFDTQSSASFDKVRSPLIKSISQVSKSGSKLKVEITLEGPATVKDSRVQKKVVLDVTPSGPMPKAEPPKPVEKKAETKEERKEAKAEALAVPAIPEKEKAAEPPPAAQLEMPAKKPEPVAAAVPAMPAVPVEPVQNISSDQVASQLKDAIAGLNSSSPAQPAETASQESSGEDDEDTSPAAITKITLSFLSPSKLAVFERSMTLWIVTDSTAGTIRPSITGSMAAFITPAKTLRFDGGTAYSYILPKKFYISVKKQKLSWQVQLLSEKPLSPPPDEMRVSFDQVSRKARLIVALDGAGELIPLEDPVVGDTLYVVPTDKADQAIRYPRTMADFSIVPAAMGMVLRPVKDGLIAAPTSDHVVLTAPEGLSVTPEGVGTPVMIGEADAISDDDNNRLFDFPNWRDGGVLRLQKNKERLQDKIVDAQSSEERAGLLMKLAMLYFANNFGQEALGILELVQKENPEMEKNPDFIAIRGAANAMSGNYRDALQDLSYPEIQQHPEVNLWRGYAAAATEQWRMAERSFPKSNRLLLQYPDNIAIPFTIYMAESALHLGHTDTAKKLLDTINMASDAMDPRYQAAIDYLRGETFAQDGKLDKAEEIWRPVSKGLDRLYHTKASLSLTRLLLRQKKIPLKEAIEEIDNLRFAWRGDGLEVEVLKALGEMKVQNNQVLAGLEDMKQAATLSDSILDDSSYIREEMERIFSDLFVGGQAGKIPPLEAVSVYNEFKSLLPSGAEGVAAKIDFANYLIRIDLLGKAQEIMEEQIRNGLPVDKAMSLGAKLAAVYLLDKKPQGALNALRATDTGGINDKLQEERNLLKARALSQLNQTDAAISVLSSMNSTDARRLKADVLWRAGKWNGAALAIEDMLPDASALTEEDAPLVVNAAVAWKLAANRDKLKEIKDRYEAAMKKTKMSSTFGVVTRDGGLSDLSDRGSMLKIAGEVDMFKGFLDTYKSKDDPGGGKGG